MNELYSNIIRKQLIVNNFRLHAAAVCKHPFIVKIFCLQTRLRTTHMIKGIRRQVAKSRDRRPASDSILRIVNRVVKRPPRSHTLFYCASAIRSSPMKSSCLRSRCASELMLTESTPGTGRAKAGERAHVMRLFVNHKKVTATGKGIGKNPQRAAGNGSRFATGSRSYGCGTRGFMKRYFVFSVSSPCEFHKLFFPSL